jgi:serine/threonine protein kinase
LLQVCGEDAAIKRRVRALLKAYQESANFLESPAASLVAALDEPMRECPGTVIGPYKLLEQIGEGGMGLVFMAEQSRPVRRRVALKVIKPGMDTRHVVVRFEAERQALALMDHPNIAKVFDGGTTASGRPYFVMELVRGVHITEFCDQRPLTMRQRLELFVTVCQAVQHAHQKGIIHRDLKPSNVLVTLHDVVAVPKVIDFGIAKATTQPLTERTLFTNFAQMMGTPLYMSPEQAEMNGLDVDTRSDVYALGVLLYELLTGTTPFESQTLKKVGLDEIRRMIREDEPPTPSQRLSTLAAQICSTVSERRGVDSRQLGQVLRGELDWIVMKALEKDRDRRYESASALAADVQRYLNDEAVLACPPSAGYRLRKYVRRNRRPLVTAGIIMATMVAASVVSVWQAVVARDAQHQAEADRDRAATALTQAEAAERQAKTDQERAQAAERRATTEAAIARAVNDFLQADLLGQVGSLPQFNDEFGSSQNLTVREALDRAAAKIGDGFRDQPLVEAAVRKAIGGAYGSLHAPQLARPHLERALALRQTHLGPDHRHTLDSAGDLAGVYSWVGQHADSILLRQRILENRRKLLGSDAPETLASIQSLAIAYYWAVQSDKSVPLLEHLLEKQRTICEPKDRSTLDTMHALALAYRELDRVDESMAIHEQILERLKSRGQPDSVPYLKHFAQTCLRAGKLDRADQLLREALEIDRNRAKDSQGGRNSLANTLGWLALNLSLQKRYDEAEPLTREAVAINQNEEHRRFYWVSVWGAILLGQKKYAEAEPLLLKGYEEMKRREAILRGEDRRLMSEAGERVVRFYEVINQPEKARQWREKLKARVK